jgi:hypothetical protein
LKKLIERFENKQESRKIEARKTHPITERKSLPPRATNTTALKLEEKQDIGTDDHSKENK